VLILLLTYFISVTKCLVSVTIKVRFQNKAQSCWRLYSRYVFRCNVFFRLELF